ncbi:hypothetical protein SLJ91_05815 [Acinetobacter pittii]|uniref:hypothetical protein n=1 Tax=Acinetobacter pittii TaxID=48296 RepID=UPI0008284AF7|nr:hypothetical protein [Acinetobacter pittii]MBJ9717801.1 hypothetical protein [Acinetobacter pittii]MBJ9776243.1 hypothetical protein [Acinetobacter pittii]MDX8202926.1 hypothetical protein [Acinetobacter pittii]MDX8228696.1 hypothetical protein [Acinetobacter pittii]OCR45450.1 hypothetical protein A4220_02770 [Acinetobacter pittii]
MEILTREEQINLIDDLPDELWIEWVLLMGDITSFYSGLDSMRFTKVGDKSIDDGVSRILSLLHMNEANLNIEFFRDFFKHEVESIGGKFKKLKPFPAYYNPRDKLLSKSEDVELTFYFAVKNCISYKNSKNIYDLLTATRLRGYAVGLSGINGLLLPKYHDDIKIHDLGGQAVANKADLAKQQVIALWLNRFDNPKLKPKHKKFKAQLAQWIIENPQIIIDQQGSPLTKNNGEAWYTDKNTISGILVGY